MREDLLSPVLLVRLGYGRSTSRNAKHKNIFPFSTLEVVIAYLQKNKMSTASKTIVAMIFSIFLNNYPLQAQNITLENLPTGNYYYERIRSEKTRNQYVLLCKSGHIVAGIEVISRFGNPCFKGFVNQNSVVNATRVFPPYNPASKWEHQKGEAINLDSYRRIERAITASDQAALMKCIRVFSE